MNGRMLSVGALAILISFPLLVDAATVTPIVGNIYSVKEDYDGQFMIGPSAPQGSDPRYSINVQNLLAEFYKTYNDEYDFLVVIPNKNLTSDYSYLINRSETGYGFNPQHNHASTTRLKSIAASTAYNQYTFFGEVGFNSSNAFESAVTTTLHEIAHHWCCSSNLNLPNIYMHYSYLADLFNRQPAVADIMGYGHWYTTGQGTKGYTNNNYPGVTHKFSNLTLYLMGLIPKSQVGPIEHHNFRTLQNPPSPTYNLYGPYPGGGEPVEWLDVKTYTIDEIIRNVGERNPSHSTSQKDFNVGYIIVTDRNTTVPQGFINSVRNLSEQVRIQWSFATNNYSRLINNAGTLRSTVAPNPTAGGNTSAPSIAVSPPTGTTSVGRGSTHNYSSTFTWSGGTPNYYFSLAMIDNRVGNNPWNIQGYGMTPLSGTSPKTVTHSFTFPDTSSTAFKDQMRTKLRSWIMDNNDDEDFCSQNDDSEYMVLYDRADGVGAYMLDDGDCQWRFFPLPSSSTFQLCAGIDGTITQSFTGSISQVASSQARCTNITLSNYVSQAAPDREMEQKRVMALLIQALTSLVDKLRPQN